MHDSLGGRSEVRLLVNRCDQSFTLSVCGFYFKFRHVTGWLKGEEEPMSWVGDCQVGVAVPVYI